MHIEGGVSILAFVCKFEFVVREVVIVGDAHADDNPDRIQHDIALAALKWVSVKQKTRRLGRLTELLLGSKVLRPKIENNTIVNFQPLRINSSLSKATHMLFKPNTVPHQFLFDGI